MSGGSFRVRNVPTWLRILAALSLVMLVLTILHSIPSGSVALSPHAPVDIQDRMRVDGKPIVPLNGKLYLVGVQEERVSILQKLIMRVDSNVSFQRDTTPAEREKRIGQVMIGMSKEISAAVGFDLLGDHVQISGHGVSVVAVTNPGPSHGKVKPGDIIVQINSRRIYSEVDVYKIIGSLAPRTEVTLGIRRQRRPVIVKVRTGRPLPNDDLHRSRLGVNLTTDRLKIVLPHRFTVKTGAIVGPSAGLAFALALFDSRSELDVLKGRFIVASGELTLDGGIHAVGGIRQKAIAAQNAGADVFLLPIANAPLAKRVIEEHCKTGRCTEVLGVKSVKDAINQLR